MNNYARLPEEVKVKVEMEYEVDIDHVESKYVNIERFDQDEAIRMLKDDIAHDQLDINVERVVNNNSEVVIQVKNGDYITMQFASDTEHVEGCDSSIECCMYSNNCTQYATFDYNSEQKQYDNIKDAIDDVIDFLYCSEYQKMHKARYYTIIPTTIAQFLLNRGE